MPLKRRRNSGQGDGNERENRGNRMSIDQCDDVNDEKSSKGGGKNEGQEKPQKIVKQDPVLAGPVTGSTKGQDVPRVGAFTRSRVVRKPKREYSPPESPVKKTTRSGTVGGKSIHIITEDIDPDIDQASVSRPVPKETKTNTPETKTKRQWELWSLEDKCTFFEALFEAGKDFDFIQNWINQKCKKKGVPPGLIKNKDQVRHFYYRTWHKISKFIDISSDVKKDIQEVYGLINYGALRKKIKGGLNEKNGAKLNELIYKGYTTVKVRGKNLRIKTPVCNALKKLNCIDNGDGKSDTSAKVPEKIHIEMTPRTNAGWSYVQEMALNPRVRMLLKPDRTLSSVIKYLNNKWKPHRLKLKENLSEGSDITKVQTLYPHRECEVTPVSLQSIKEPKFFVSLSHYKEQCNTTGSPTANKMKKTEVKSGKVEPPITAEGGDQPAFPIDSPRPNKQAKEVVLSKNDKVLPMPGASVDVSALMDGDNAVFPDVPLSGGMKDKDSNSTEMGSQTMEVSTEMEATNCEKSDQAKSPPMCVNEKGDSAEVIGSTENSQPDVAQHERELQAKKVTNLVDLGLSESTAEYVTLAELYLMFGKDGKLRMEYDWCKDEASVLTSELTNMLRRLVHLATIEFTDFCSKPTGNSVSPCHACGAVRAKNNRAVNNVKGQKATGRSPLMSKFGPGDGMVDAGTQTHGSILPPKRFENSSQGKDAVFRVPVCSPSFLQRSTHAGANHQIISHANLFPTQRGIKKIRNSNRKSMIVQRNILPKQMVTILRPVGQPQPVAIPVSIPSPMSSTGLLKVPSGQQLSAASNVRASVSTTTVTPSGTFVQLNVQPQPPGMVVNPGVEGVTVSQLLGNISVDVSSNSASTLMSSMSTNGGDVTLTTSSSTIPSSLSPPNISSLLDLSLSNLPAGSAESTDKFIDLALGNSNSSFSAILDGHSVRDSLLNTPNAKSTSTLSPPASPSPWLNGEDTNDLTFMNLLSASPMKSEPSLATAVSSHSSLFSESSRDAIMGRLPADVDGTFQSMLNENSMDYAVKFADLAAHIDGSSDQSLNNLKKTDTSG